MHDFETILFLAMVLLVLAPLARRYACPLPVIQVLGGALLSPLPWLRHVPFAPDLIFLVFVPPLLYWGCITASMRDLRRQRTEIGLLAVGAVVVTVAAVAVASHCLAPHLPWAAAVVLGAVIAPPDASVTIAITRQIGLPRRLAALLEGEAMFNDIASFTIYRLAIAATLASGFTAWQELPLALYTAAGAAGIGWLVAQGVMWLRRHIRDAVVANILSLMTAYAAYLPAEWANTSGVVAVVTTGLILSRGAPRLVDAATRLQAQQVWPLVMFMLNGLIFLLVGLQMGTVARQVISHGSYGLLGIAFAMSLVVVVVRMVFVLGVTGLRLRLARARAPALPGPAPSPSGRQRTRPAPWGEALFVAWTGIRGGDTMVTALAIPLVVRDGQPFPGRDEILTIALAVILVTLVLQGGTLRFLMARLGLREDAVQGVEDRLARRQLAEAGMERLRQLAEERHLPEDVVDQIRIHHHMRRHVRSGSEDQPQNLRSSIVARHLLDINREVIRAERERVLDLRDQEEIGDDVHRAIQRELDLEELVMMRRAEDV